MTSFLVDTPDVCDGGDLEDGGDARDVEARDVEGRDVEDVAQAWASDAPPLAATSDAPPPPATSAPAMVGLAGAAGAVHTPLPLPLHAPLGGRAGDGHGGGMPSVAMPSVGMASVGMHDGRSEAGMHDIGSGFGESGALSQVDSDLLWAMRDDDEVAATAALASGLHPPRSFSLPLSLFFVRSVSLSL